MKTLGRQTLALVLLLSAIHLTLWWAWPPYRYGLVIRVPTRLVYVVGDLRHSHQIEDIPEDVAVAVLFAGFLLTLAIGGAVLSTSILISRRRQSRVNPPTA